MSDTREHACLRSIEADFDTMRWTFEMIDSQQRVGAGYYLLVPVDGWENADKLAESIRAMRPADSAVAVDSERVEIARCPRCGSLPRPTLMGRTICDRCGGLDVPQPPSPTVLQR